MPYELTFEAEEGYLRAVFTGRVTMQVVRDYLQVLLPKLEETKCQRLLSDCSAAEIHFSSLDIMQFPKLAAASPLTEILKRAVVAKPGTSGYEMYETISTMQGQFVRVFSDHDEALEWLLSDQD